MVRVRAVMRKTFPAPGEAGLVAGAGGFMVPLELGSAVTMAGMPFRDHRDQIDPVPRRYLTGNSRAL